MFLVIINALLYVGVALYYWHSRHKFDAFLLIILAYTVTAILCALYYSTGPKEYQSIKLYPFIYLWAVLLLFLAPLRDFSVNVRSLEIRETWLIKLLTWVAIVSGLIALAYTIPNAVELIRSGEWGALRNSLYEDEESVVLYHSVFEKLSKNVSHYMHPFTVIIAIYQLTRPKIKKLTTILLLVAWLGYGFFGAMLVASRGMVFNMLLELLLVLIIFKDSIPKGAKKAMVVLGIVLLVPVVMYLSAVTVSRFGESEASSSVFAYFGHSMLNFNANMMVPMHDYAGGKYFAKYILDYLHIDSSINLQSLGYTGGTGFYTFIGSFYMDFGPIGTFFLAIVMMFFLRRFVHRRRIVLTDLMVVVYFSYYYLRGVLVIGKSSALEWLMLFFLCVIINFAGGGRGFARMN